MLIITIASILLFVGHHNSAKDSWFNSRIDVARDAITNKVWNFKPGTLIGRAETARQWAEAHHFASEHDIDLHLRALEEARVNRVILLGIPFFGVSHDVNDLGLLGSVALLVLMASLKYAMARQHENLYLALYRVRQLFRQEGEVPSQNGTANLVYHSLAMSQQFTQPPSLARWGAVRRLGFSWVLLPLPLAVQMFALWHDWSSRSFGLVLNANATISSLIVQAISLIAVLLLTIACFLYCHSNDIRWRKTFFYINPNLSTERQPSWFEWVQLIRPRHKYCSQYHGQQTDDTAPGGSSSDARRAVASLDSTIPPLGNLTP